MPVLYFMMIHLVLKVTSDDVREALLVAPLAVPSLRVKDLSGSGSTHGSSLQFWHFPIYGEDACVLEGRHGGLVGTKALGEENGSCLLYGYDYGFVFGFLCLLFASQWML